MGNGKTVWIIRHIMISETLFDKLYNDTIIFSSTSLDNTSRLQRQTPITYNKNNELMYYLNKNIGNKMKYNSIVKFIKPKTKM